MRQDGNADGRMKGNFLERDYFYDRNMIKDENVAIAGNCLEQLAAIIMKNTYPGKIDYYAMAIEDLSYHVRFDRDGYLTRSALKCNEAGLGRKPWDIRKQVVVCNREEAIGALEHSLDAYGYAIVRTTDGHLEFSKNYNEAPDAGNSFDYKNFPEMGHVFLIIGEDEENYYYIEQPSEINRKYYIHAEGRRDIGMYPKEKFYRAFELYLGLFFVEFHEEYMDRGGELGQRILHQSKVNFRNNYASRVPENDSFSILGGRAALVKIKDMLEQGKLILDRKVFHPSVQAYGSHTIGEEFLNGLTSILNRREAMEGYLRNQWQESDVLIQDIALWKQAKEKVLYQCSVGGKTLKKEDIRFEEIAQAEERLLGT